MALQLRCSWYAQNSVAYARGGRREAQQTNRLVQPQQPLQDESGVVIVDAAGKPSS